MAKRRKKKKKAYLPALCLTCGESGIVRATDSRGAYDGEWIPVIAIWHRNGRICHVKGFTLAEIQEAEGS